MKRLLSIIWSIIIVFSVVPLAVFADTSGDYEYTDNGDGTCTITGYTGTGGYAVIPYTIGSLTVVEIAADALSSKGLVGVSIPDIVEKIGANAFSGNSFSEFTLPIISKPGYDFNGWIDGNDAHHEGGDTVTDFALAYTAQVLQSACISSLTTSQKNGNFSNAATVDNESNTVSATVYGQDHYIGISLANSNATYTLKDGSGNAIAHDTNASPMVSLQMGDNTFTIEVVTEDSNTRTYTMTLTREICGNADLNSVTLRQIGGVAYSVSATVDDTSGTVTATVTGARQRIELSLADATASVVVKDGLGNAIPIEYQGYNISLSMGANSLTFEVTAEDGTKKTYNVTLTRVIAQNNDIDMVQVNQKPSGKSVTATVDNDDATVTATTTGEEQRLSIHLSDSGSTYVLKDSDGTEIPYVNNLGLSLSLSLGDNLYTLDVTAEDGTTKTYDVTLTREISGDTKIRNVDICPPTGGFMNVSATVDDTAGTVTATVSGASQRISLSLADATASAVIKDSLGNVVPYVKERVGYIVNLSLGANSYTIEVTAEDGTTKTYAVTLTRVIGSDALLMYLDVNANGSNVLSGFDKNTFVYNGLTSPSGNIYLYTTPSAGAQCTLKLNGVNQTPSSGSYSITLPSGSSQITIAVTSEDGLNTNTYTLNITKAANNDNYLFGCWVSFGNDLFTDGLWGSSKIPSDSAIDLEMPNYFSQCKLNARCADGSYATYQICDGDTVLSDNTPYTIDMPSPGTQTYTIKVTAEDGSVRDYTVNVTRKAADNKALAYKVLIEEDGGEDYFDSFFEPNHYVANLFTDYTFARARIMVYLMDSDTTCQIYLNSNLIDEDTIATADLVEGMNRVEVKLTSATNVSRTYTFNILREDKKTTYQNLNTITMRSVNSDSYYGGKFSESDIDGFSRDVTSYDVELPNSSQSIVLGAYARSEDSVIEAKKDGVSITADDNGEYCTDLNTGMNEFTFDVSHPDLTGKKTYTVNVTRAAQDNTNTDLAGLFFNSNKISDFDPDTTSYERTYPYTLNSVAPFVSDANATYQIFLDDKLAADNVPIVNKSVVAEDTKVYRIVVTAADSVTKKTYTLTVLGRSENAKLNAISIQKNNYSQSAEMADGIYTYSLKSINWQGTMLLSASNSDGATIKLYREDELLSQGTSGFLWADVDLDVGLNTFTLEVTAKDGETQNTYTVNITRAAKPAADNANLSSVSMYMDKSYENFLTPPNVEYQMTVPNDSDNAECYYAAESGDATTKMYLNDVFYGDSNSKPYDGYFDLPLIEGDNVIKVVVTAQDGVTTKTYLFKVTRTPDADIDEYTVTAVSNNSAYGTVSGGGTYAKGESAALTATPASGCRFVRWTDNGSQVSTDASYTFAVNNDISLVAVFERIPYSISVSANDASYGNVTGGGTYYYGDSVTLSATPKTGFRFVRWTENGAEAYTGASNTFTVTRARSLVAEFTPLTQISIRCTKTDATTYNGTNGSVTVTASGGNSGTYEYSINNGNWQGSNVFGGLAAGTYTVTVRDAGFKDNSAKCSVSIDQPAYVGKVPANKVPQKAAVDTAITVTPPAAPKGYTMQTVTYASSNPSVATVDVNGNVTFLAGGKVMITTTIVSTTVDKNGKVKTKTTTVKKTITVNQLVETISLNTAKATIARTQKVTLAANIAPGTASNKQVTWKSSNPKVASVSGSGVVTGKVGGTAIITCTAKDGSGASASCTVTVTPMYPTGLKMSKAALTIKTGKTAALRATIAPAKTDFKTVTWVSSNPAVAIVDSKGKVKAIAPGTAVITATTSNGISAACTVTVQ